METNMKKQSIFLSLLLAVIMAFSSTAVYANGLDPHENLIVVTDGEAKIIGAGVQEDYDGSVLDGDLTVENNSTALQVEARNNESEFTVTGVVTETREVTDPDGEYATAVWVRAENHAAEATVGSVTATATFSHDQSYPEWGAFAVDASRGLYGDFNGETEDATVTVNGDAKAKASFTSTAPGYIYVITRSYAVNACAESKETMVTVNGNADAVATSTGAKTKNMNTKAYAVHADATGEGTKTTVTVTGQASADVVAEPDGRIYEFAVDADAADNGQTKVTIGKGAQGVVSADAKTGGTTTVEILSGGIEHENPGGRQEEKYGTLDTVNEGGTVNVIVRGGITAKKEDAIDIDNQNGTTDVNVTGDIEAIYGNGTAVWAETKGENAETVLTLNGDITARGTDAAIGVGLEASEKATVTATITGQTLTAAVVEAQVDTQNANQDAGTQTEATGLYLENNGAEMNVMVKSDILATGADHSTGVEINNTMESENGITNLTITGDVTGDQLGLDLAVSDVQKANIVVDGTVSGGDTGIVLRNETELDDNLTLTVWEVVPDQNKAVITREGTDGEGNIIYEEDIEAEKLLQYIIKIEDNSSDYITTSGTSDFKAGNGETYQIANEGDKILVKLNIPEGRELVGAYWDEEQTEAGKLLVDPETGDYYVEVPRGGGVILSVVLKEVPQPEPEPEPEPEPKPGPKPKPGLDPDPEPDPDPDTQPAPKPDSGTNAVSQTADQTQTGTENLLLTITDNTSTVIISFYSGGRYVAEGPGNRKETGRYKLENGQIVLINSAKHEMPITKNGNNWKLLYTSGTDTTPYEFMISDEDVQTLTKALK